MVTDSSDYVRKKIKKYTLSEMVFTKGKLLGWLERRNSKSLAEMKKEIFGFEDLDFVYKQEVEYEGKKEERYRCYFVYSGSKGRCYVITFNSKIKIITVFPLGRTTLRKYRKRFK